MLFDYYILLLLNNENHILIKSLLIKFNKSLPLFKFVCVKTHLTYMLGISFVRLHYQRVDLEVLPIQPC